MFFLDHGVDHLHNVGAGILGQLHLVDDFVEHGLVFHPFAARDFVSVLGRGVDVGVRTVQFGVGVGIAEFLVPQAFVIPFAQAAVVVIDMMAWRCGQSVGVSIEM